jgi:hypothetical protein
MEPKVEMCEGMDYTWLRIGSVCRYGHCGHILFGFLIGRGIS